MEKYIGVFFCLASIVYIHPSSKFSVHIMWLYCIFLGFLILLIKSLSMDRRGFKIDPFKILQSSFPFKRFSIFLEINSPYLCQDSDYNLPNTRSD